MKSSAPPNAPIGVQRPKITAARAMNPRFAVIPFWNEALNSRVSQAPARPANTPPRIDVAVADPDHVDADGVGGPRVLADGPGPEPPAGSEEHDLENDDEDDDGRRDRA